MQIKVVTCTELGNKQPIKAKPSLCSPMTWLFEVLSGSPTKNHISGIQAVRFELTFSAPTFSPPDSLLPPSPPYSPHCPTQTSKFFPPEHTIHSFLTLSWWCWGVGRGNQRQGQGEHKQPREATDSTVVLSSQVCLCCRSAGRWWMWHEGMGHKF